MYIRDDSISLLDFMDWLDSEWDAVTSFCIFAPLCFLFALYTSYIHFILIQPAFSYKKNYHKTIIGILIIRWASPPQVYDHYGHHYHRGQTITNMILWSWLRVLSHKTVNLSNTNGSSSSWSMSTKLC